MSDTLVEASAVVMHALSKLVRDAAMLRETTSLYNCVSWSRRKDTLYVDSLDSNLNQNNGAIAIKTVWALVIRQPL